MIGRLRAAVASQGVLGPIRAVFRRILRPRTRTFRRFSHLLVGRSGLEIGGPSATFARGGQFPIYPHLESLDNCNFSKRTIWEGALEEGRTFRYDRDRTPGRQLVAEAADLRAIADGTYEFVLSSHAIEHTANPLLALTEWKRVVRQDGYLLLVVPHRDGTFDHRRPVTLLSHLKEDFAVSQSEADMTHLPEVLALHDLRRDSLAGDREAFEARCRRNFENRAMHHHVFDTRLVADLLHHAGWQLLAIEPVAPLHIFALARKLGAQDPGAVAMKELWHPSKSPFPSDRRTSSGASFR